MNYPTKNINDYLWLNIVAHTSTGGNTDASTAVYQIYASNSTVLVASGNLNILSTTLTGVYTARPQLSTSNGFANNTDYIALKTATIGGVVTSEIDYFEIKSSYATSTEVSILPRTTDIGAQLLSYTAAKTTDIGAQLLSYTAAKTTDVGAELLSYTAAKTTDISGLFSGIIADTTSINTTAITRDSALISLFLDSFGRKGASTGYNELYNLAGDRIATQTLTEATTLFTRGKITNV